MPRLRIDGSNGRCTSSSRAAGWFGVCVLLLGCQPAQQPGVPRGDDEAPEQSAELGSDCNHGKVSATYEASLSSLKAFGVQAVLFESQLGLRHGGLLQGKYLSLEGLLGSFQRFEAQLPERLAQAPHEERERFAELERLAQVPLTASELAGVAACVRPSLRSFGRALGALTDLYSEMLEAGAAAQPARKDLLSDLARSRRDVWDAFAEIRQRAFDLGARVEVPCSPADAQPGLLALHRQTVAFGRERMALIADFEDNDEDWAAIAASGQEVVESLAERLVMRRETYPNWNRETSYHPVATSSRLGRADAMGAIASQLLEERSGPATPKCVGDLVAEIGTSLGHLAEHYREQMRAMNGFDSAEHPLDSTPGATHFEGRDAFERALDHRSRAEEVARHVVGRYRVVRELARELGVSVDPGDCAPEQRVRALHLVRQRLAPWLESRARFSRLVHQPEMAPVNEGPNEPAALLELSTLPLRTGWPITAELREAALQLSRRADELGEFSPNDLPLCAAQDVAVLVVGAQRHSAVLRDLIELETKRRASHALALKDGRSTSRDGSRFGSQHDRLSRHLEKTRLGMRGRLLRLTGDARRGGR